MILLKTYNIFSNILGREVIKTSQLTINIYHILIFLSFIFSLYLYYINLIKPYLINRKQKYLIEYECLKWLVEKHKNKYIISEVPFCLECEIECIYDTFAHWILAMHCPMCNKMPQNTYLFNKHQEVQNIINSKGLKYFIHKKFKGTNEIRFLNLEYKI